MPERRSRDLARNILSVLANPDAWHQMQREARRYVETNLRSAVVVNNVLTTLQRVSAG